MNCSTGWCAEARHQVAAIDNATSEARVINLMYIGN
jgi:hypothetical protein